MKINLRRWLILSLLVVTISCTGIVLGILATEKYRDDQIRINVVSYGITTQNLLKEGRLDEAALAASGLIVLKPEAYDAYLMLGEIYSKQGYVPSARWAYQRAAEKLDQGGSLYAKFTEESKARERERVKSILQTLK